MESRDSKELDPLVQQLRSHILSLWPCQSLQVHLHPLLDSHELYAHSCSPRHVSEEEHRHNQVAPDRILRRQLADSITPFLKTLANNPPEDLLLVCPGLVYLHDAKGILQPRHEIALWRLTAQNLPLSALDDLHDAAAGILPRGMRLRTRRANQPYLVYSQGLEAYCGGWKWIGHCGLLNPMLLIECGFDPVSTEGLALSLDLDRCLALRDKWDEICLRRRS
jgi:phenylalanyl-tRNA synthetase alpha chain